MIINQIYTIPINCLNESEYADLQQTLHAYKEMYDEVVNIICEEKSPVYHTLYKKHYKAIRAKYHLPSRLIETAFVRACTSVCNYNKIVRSAGMRPRDQRRLRINHVDMEESENAPTLMWNSDRLHLPKHAGNDFYHLTQNCIREIENDCLKVCAHTSSTWWILDTVEASLDNDFHIFKQNHPQHKLVDGILFIDTEFDVVTLNLNYEIPDSKRAGKQTYEHEGIYIDTRIPIHAKS